MAAAALKEGARPGAQTDAAAIWTMMLQEIPEQPYALLNLGGIRYSAGDRPGCREFWQRFLRNYPDRPEAGEVRGKLATLDRAGARSTP
jgi:regulator of sirC expression with transglutaminase-like and TPR domain